MRKLMSKKGFTLVELMIVVVILGILVAVAVPIFSAVTKNARTKSCKANMRVIKGNIETYQATGNNGDEVVFSSGTTDLATDKPSALMKLFDGGEFPKCPTDNTKDYIVKVVNDNGQLSYLVQCQTSEAEAHNG